MKIRLMLTQNNGNVVLKAVAKHKAIDVSRWLYGWKDGKLFNKPIIGKTFEETAETVRTILQESYNKRTTYGGFWKRFFDEDFPCATEHDDGPEIFLMDWDCDSNHWVY